ncbi:MAG: AI-2E family transporter [Candidatus Saganbacteria bacterium]|nr:AI-2E family transporter [Candidatus Saganbacteria bacterium]
MNTMIHFRWKMLLIPVIILTILYMMYRVPNTIGTFLIGLMIYLILDPLVDALAKRYKSRALITLIVFTLVLLLFVLFLVPLNYLAQVELPKFITQTPVYLESFKSMIKAFDSKFAFLSQLLGLGSQGIFTLMFKSMASQNFVTTIASNSADLFMKIATISFDFIMGLIIAAYLIIDEPRILSFIEKHLPKKLTLINREMWHDMLRCISGYFGGILLLGLILFALSWIGLAVLNVPYAFMLSVWAGMTIIIPYIGPFAGSIPAVAVALTNGIWLGTIVAVFMTILQFIVTSVVGPKVLGEIIGIHPIIVILALIIGGELGGLVGMILAVPLTSVIVIFLRYYWPMFIED